MHLMMDGGTEMAMLIDGVLTHAGWYKMATVMHTASLNQFPSNLVQILFKCDLGGLRENTVVLV